MRLTTKVTLGADVRFGSLAAPARSSWDVRFTPPKAAAAVADRRVRFGPIADMTQYYAAIILIACAFWLLHLWFD